VRDDELRQVDQLSEIRWEGHQSPLGQTQPQNLERLALPDCRVWIDWPTVSNVCHTINPEFGREICERSLHLVPLGQRGCAFLLGFDAVLFFKPLSLGCNARLWKASARA